MPILHRQIQAVTQDPNGNNVILPPPLGMILLGPQIEVSVGLASSFATPLAQQGFTVPSPVTGKALIDTGASTTCIDSGVASQLNLPVVDVVQMSSASHASSVQNVHPIRVEILGWGMQFDAPRAMGATLANQGLLLLIGRDVLSRFTLFYNGITGEFTLSF